MSSKYEKKLRPDPVVIIHEPDWPNVVGTLRKQGYPLSGLARACGCSRDTMYRIQGGMLNPEWFAGSVLLHLFKEVS
jgi:hypothetical protein